MITTATRARTRANSLNQTNRLHLLPGPPDPGGSRVQSGASPHGSGFGAGGMVARHALPASISFRQFSPGVIWTDMPPWRSVPDPAAGAARRGRAGPSQTGRAALWPLAPANLAVVEEEVDTGLG